MLNLHFPNHREKQQVHHHIFRARGQLDVQRFDPESPARVLQLGQGLPTTGKTCIYQHVLNAAVCVCIMEDPSHATGGDAGAADSVARAHTARQSQRTYNLWLHISIM